TVTQQMVAKCDHLLPIFPGVRVCDRSNLVGADGAARIGEHRRVESTFDGAGFARRPQLWSRQIGFEKFVGDQQPAVGVAIRQMMATGEPKILHSRFPCANVAKSTGSAGSFSTSTSRKENARHRLEPPRERRRRKVS